MTWLKILVSSTNMRPMAYKRPSERRFTVMFAITLICLGLTIALSLAGIIN